MLAVMTFWEWMQFGGYVAEVVGIGLAVWEIRERGKQFAEFETGQRRIELHGEPILLEIRTQRGELHVTPPTPPTMEQRIDFLERYALPNIVREIDALEKSAAATAEAQTRRIIRPVQASLQSDLAKLVTALRGSLSGHRRARASLAMLLVGLVLQGVGSLAGAHDATRAGSTTAVSDCTLVAPGCRMSA
jgi:hypothetical protein